MKVGDEVYLREDSKWNNLRPSNPINCIGIVDEIYPDYNLGIGVRWSNNEHNAYNEADLILASEYNKENMPEPKGHPNASILMEIAKEAAINPEYWKEFEFQSVKNDSWEDCSHAIMYALYMGYPVRRKPRTIRIGNYDVPEPMRNAPEEGKEYFLVRVYSGDVIGHIWENDQYTRGHLKSGLMQETKEGAELMLKALQELLSQTK